MAEPRYRVRRDEHHGGGLFELEITITWEIVEVATGAVVRRLRDDESASYDGVGWSGGAGPAIAEVTIEGDALVCVRFQDGRISREPL